MVLGSWCGSGLRINWSWSCYLCFCDNFISFLHSEQNQASFIRKIFSCTWFTSELCDGHHCGHNSRWVPPHWWSWHMVPMWTVRKRGNSSFIIHPIIQTLQSSHLHQIVRSEAFPRFDLVHHRHRQLQKQQIATMIDPQIANGHQQDVIIGSFISSGLF